MTSAPATAPSTATNTHDEPSSAVRRRTSRALRGIGAPAETNDAFPSATWLPSTLPSIPAPCCSTTSVGNVRPSPCSRAARTIDVASTWGDTWSREAERRSNSSAGMSSNTSTSAICGTPAVSVPVLSNSSTFPCASVSSAPPPFTMIPRRAAREMPATTAIGTARISGHGVATTSTASARTASPESSQAAPAIASVTGMKITAYRSATRTNGAFCFSASWTSRTMPAYVLSAAVATARRSTAEPAFTAPDRIWSPSGRSDGRDSPVSADSSKTPADISTPSTGTTSPVFTNKRSPGCTSSIGRTTSSPPSYRVTIRGARSRRAESSRWARRSA